MYYVCMSVGNTNESWLPPSYLRFFSHVISWGRHGAVRCNEEATYCVALIRIHDTILATTNALDRASFSSRLLLLLLRLCSRQMTLVIVQVLHQLYSLTNGSVGAKKNMNHFQCYALTKTHSFFVSQERENMMKILLITTSSCLSFYIFIIFGTILFLLEQSYSFRTNF